MLSDAIKANPHLDQGITISAALRENDPSLRIELADEKARFNLRLREANISAFSEATGLSLPSQIGATDISNDEIIMCLGPDEWLLVTLSDAKAHVKEQCAQYTASPFSLVDVSHRNVAFHISGEGASDLLNVGCPLDLDLAAFPVGRCTRTIFERAEIVLMREAEQQFHIEIWRSFAPYFLSVLSNGGQAQ